jgi:hypothetical protein
MLGIVDHYLPITHVILTLYPNLNPLYFSKKTYKVLSI